MTRRMPRRLFLTMLFEKANDGRVGSLRIHMSARMDELHHGCAVRRGKERAMLSPRLAFLGASVELPHGIECGAHPFVFHSLIVRAADQDRGLGLQRREIVRRCGCYWRDRSQDLATLRPEQIGKVPS